MRDSLEKFRLVRKKEFKEFLDRSHVSYLDETLSLELTVISAHAKMLLANSILTTKEYESVVQHNKELTQDIYLGKIACPATYHELFFEVIDNLFAPLLDVAQKLQIGRNFKDQNVLALKLLIRSHANDVRHNILLMQQALLDVSKKYFNAIIPGFNHLQQSVPNLVSNYFMAYYTMLERDLFRMDEVIKSCSIMPIGVDIGLERLMSLDRQVFFDELKMVSVSKNNIDAVSDRDFAIDFQSALSAIMTHLCRLSEELILWSTSEFGYITIPDGYTLGTDTLPRRKTPDVLEMIRAKSSQVFGNLTTSMTMYRTLPLGQLSDYEDEREVLFDSAFIVQKSLKVMRYFLMDMTVNTQKALTDVVNNYGLSFVIIEYLLQKGASLKEAERIVSTIIQYCKEKEVGLESLIWAEYQQFSVLLGDDLPELVDVQRLFNPKKDSLMLGSITKQTMLEKIDSEEAKILKLLQVYTK